MHRLEANERANRDHTQRAIHQGICGTGNGPTRRTDADRNRGLRRPSSSSPPQATSRGGQSVASSGLWQRSEGSEIPAPLRSWARRAAVTGPCASVLSRRDRFSSGDRERCTVPGSDAQEPEGATAPLAAPAEKAAHYLPLSPTTEAVLQLLLRGDLSRLRAESVAEALGISCTTLRRRLREDHTNYQFLLDRARQYRCEALLQKRWLPGKCLADELGYLEINSFYRAFQRWTGLSYSLYCRRFRDSGRLGDPAS